MGEKRSEHTHTHTLALKCVRDYLADPTKFNKRIMENVLNFIVGKGKKITTKNNRKKQNQEHTRCL